MPVEEISGAISANEVVRPFGSKFFERLLDRLYDGVYFVDRNRTILYWNQAAERLSGYTSSEVVGHPCQDNILCHTDCQGTFLCKTGCPLLRAIHEDEPTSARVFLKHRKGHRVAVDVSVMPIYDDDGENVGAVEIFRDASPVVALESAYRQMRELAEKDPLTGAINRRQAMEMLDQQIALRRESGIPFALIMTDIDHFKRVNDGFGHAGGDAALKAFEACLEAKSRASDIVARIGGEEFLIILPDLDLEHAHRIAERLRKRVSRITFAGQDALQLTASFGVVEAEPGESLDHLLARVDAALYRAKRLGRDRVERG
ncbi:GGDEF domain-containing protein [Tautonia sp. JC769]|uniref:GGDEF domain-containing protein n=1 Tax=Tautonia sp. JC769 TaxID=3232135 RepID=UPI003458E642